MAKVTYIHTDGRQELVDVPSGQSVMQGAVLNNIAGIEAECGGSCACATCHVYLADDTLAVFPPPDEMEDDLLDGVGSERKNTSRLSCQLIVQDDTKAISVYIPEAQY